MDLIGKRNSIIGFESRVILCFHKILTRKIHTNNKFAPKISPSMSNYLHGGAECLQGKKCVGLGSAAKKGLLVVVLVDFYKWNGTHDEEKDDDDDDVDEDARLRVVCKSREMFWVACKKEQ
ncbi:unnamed protein product [Allacma fusca]|uniref:Uncharacterized protein n=1 Tax=Allacma fusca TaxID=39272 RepID=A0A8J2JU59_9HEXA|nr:unnamed protein product [Allacma fusca]